MKIGLALMVLFVNSLAFAETLNLKCQAMQNYKVVFESEVQLSPMQKNVLVGSVGLFDILVSSLGDSKVELQAYNFIEPSRTYATAYLQASAPSVDLSVWTREYLMEVSCRL